MCTLIENNSLIVLILSFHLNLDLVGLILCPKLIKLCYLYIFKILIFLIGNIDFNISQV